MTMRVLIAGCGDLGMRVAELLRMDKDNIVFGIRRHPPAIQTPESVQWIAADLTRPESLARIPEGITHLVFTAAPSERTELAYRATYLAGLQHVIQRIQSPSLKRIIFISSTAVYGDHGQDWVNEDTPTNPAAFNGRILCETECWLHAYGLHNHLSTISLRLSGIYGPKRTYLLDRLRLGQAAAPLSKEHWVNRIHIDDAAAAVVHVLGLATPASVYLVTDSTPLPMRTLYEHLAKLVGGPTPPEGLPARGVGSKRLSNARLLASGFTFKWPDSRTAYTAG
jgi:nucleoside-diphosphate-sugar epimerase